MADRSTDRMADTAGGTVIRKISSTPFVLSKMEQSEMTLKHSNGNKTGSTIIELLIYFSLFSILVGLIFPWVVQSHTRFVLFGKKLQTTIDQHCACDVLIHDIRQAPSAEQQWKQINKDTLIWNTPDYDIGWYVKNNKLMRTQGIYNQAFQTWTKKQSSVAVHNIKQIVFDVSPQQKHVQSVTYNLVLSNDKQIKRTVYLNNKVLA